MGGRFLRRRGYQGRADDGAPEAWKPGLGILTAFDFLDVTSILE
jgi:hypothetical protein